MVNRSSFHRVPRARSIVAQSPPISTSGGLGSRFRSRRPPSYHCHGGILDHHISCVLRARYRPHRHRTGSFTPGSCLIRRVTRNGCNQTLQTGVFTRGPRCLPGEGTTGVGRSFGLGGCERSSRFPRLPSHHPSGMISPTIIQSTPPRLRLIPITHAYTATTPNLTEFRYTM